MIMCTHRSISTNGKAIFYFITMPQSRIIDDDDGIRDWLYERDRNYSA